MKFLIYTVLLFAFGCSVATPEVKNASELSRFAGKGVAVTGTVSTTIWQHVMNGDSTYRFDTYLDIGDSQTVVYSKEPINCKGKIEVNGKVKEVTGLSKGNEREPFKEYHINADSWRCI